MEEATDLSPDGQCVEMSRPRMGICVHVTIAKSNTSSFQLCPL